MCNEFEPDFISLLDEDGNEYSFEILDVIEEDGRTFFALCPANDDADENYDEYLIMEETIEDDESMLSEIEDDALLERLAEIFEKHFEELYDYDEE